MLTASQSYTLACLLFMLIRDTDGIRIVLLRVVSSAYKIKLKYSVQLVVNEIGRNNCIVLSTRVLVIVEISSPMLSSVIAILNQPKWQSTYKKTCIIELFDTPILPALFLQRWKCLSQCDDFHYFKYTFDHIFNGIAAQFRICL